MPKSKVAKTFYKFIMQRLLLQFFMEKSEKVGLYLPAELLNSEF
jgi:hypothetical protein